MTDDDPILAKIRALLAHAESTNSEHEAQAMNDKAAELMAKYGIEQAVLAAGKPEANRVADLVIRADDPFGRTKALALQWIAKPLRVKAILIQKRDPNRRKRLIFETQLYGMEADLRLVEMLYTSLLVQAMQLVKIQKPWGVRGDQLAAYRRSWMIGFFTEVANRIKVREQEALERRARDEAAYTVAPGPKAELVLADRDALVARAFELAHPETKKVGVTVGAVDGYVDGQRAGRQADIGGTRVGSSQRRAIG